MKVFARKGGGMNLKRGEMGGAHVEMEALPLFL